MPEATNEKAQKLAARRSECDERHQVIEMRRTFPQFRIWPIVRVTRDTSEAYQNATYVLG